MKIGLFLCVEQMTNDRQLATPRQANCADSILRSDCMYPALSKTSARLFCRFSSHDTRKILCAFKFAPKHL
jgi:hypothetical protein